MRKSETRHAGAYGEKVRAAMLSPHDPIPGLRHPRARRSLIFRQHESPRYQTTGRRANPVEEVQFFRVQRGDRRDRTIAIASPTS
jgi:hypothetical protein